MRGGFLPPAILCVALGLLLAFTLPRRAGAAAFLMAVVAIAVFVAHPPQAWIEPIYVGCWLSVIGTAALMIGREPLRGPTAFLIAANDGLWIGAVTAVSGQKQDLAIALPLVLIFLPAHPIVRRGWSIGLKVLGSWLTAVAILATMVSLTPTPGYKPDHME